MLEQKAVAPPRPLGTSRGSAPSPADESVKGRMGARGAGGCRRVRAAAAMTAESEETSAGAEEHDRRDPVDGDVPAARGPGVAARYEHARRRLQHTTAAHVTRRALEIDVWHQALVFAALALLLLVPILISVSALVPLGDGQ